MMLYAPSDRTTYCLDIGPLYGWYGLGFIAQPFLKLDYLARARFVLSFKDVV